jgi:hypothetical protein
MDAAAQSMRGIAPFVQENAMSSRESSSCPECAESFDQPVAIDRRNFIRVVGGCAATTLLTGGTAALTPGRAAANLTLPLQQAVQPKTPHPAEALIRELHAGLTADQRQRLTLPWNNPNRTRIYNAPMNVRIGQVYTRPQQELLDRIVRAISSGDEGYRRLSRGGNWDTGGGFGGCGANFFGSMAEGQQWAWVFSGHHLTVRCDGDSAPDAAFGGPMYYGHSPDGHSVRNVFHYQTQAVNSVFSALTEAQRRTAVRTGTPGEGARSIEFRRGNYPGLPAEDLTSDQRRLVEAVMRELLSPYRREDADEVMALVRRNGGIERIHLAFYRDQGATDSTRWHFWRLEGPGFVWNYRVLPHVHCYVNIARAPQA